MDKINCGYYAVGGGQNYLPERTIWIAVKNENAHMLASDVYDAFVLVPLYFAMYYKQDLYIHGCMSKKLYKNVMNYLQRILCDFSDDLSRVDVHVEGFKEAEGEQNIIGTGISCGVDSLTTIYDRYVHEDDPDYKINALFFFNYGSCGDFGDKAYRLFLERYELNKSAADELGLPVYLVDSNLHAFTHALKGGALKIGQFANYSCVFGLGRAIKKYYSSSCISYKQLLTFGKNYHDSDFLEFSEPYSIPLIQTERLELVIDGCQYSRSEKTERIADWDIAQKHLNVCVSPIEEAHNCSRCSKCMRALIVLDALGSLDKFSEVFSIDTYRKYRFSVRCRIVKDRKLVAFYNDMYIFSMKHGVKMPSIITAYLYTFPLRIYRKLRKIFRR